MGKFKVRATVSDRGRVGNFDGEVSKVESKEQAEQVTRKALERCQFTVLGSVKVEDNNG